jgi:hypothetical protein
MVQKDTVFGAPLYSEEALYSGRRILPSSQPIPSAAITTAYGRVSILSRSHASTGLAFCRHNIGGLAIQILSCPCGLIHDAFNFGIRHFSGYQRNGTGKWYGIGT